MKRILQPYVPVAEMLAATFGDDCEVVLHDLDRPEHSVVYVTGGNVTGRKVGENFEHIVSEVLLSGKLRDNCVANYYFTAANGKRVRSSTLLIKDKGGRLAGAMCINLDVSRIAGQIAYLQSLLPPQAPPPQATESKPDGDSGGIAAMIEGLMDGIIGDADARTLTRAERVAKVRFMAAKGIFLMKGSVERAAEKLGITKVTIYSYLDEIRGKRAAGRD